MSVESYRGPGGAQLHYRYDDFTDPWEDAPTAVLCHGHPRNSNLWYEWVPLLSRRLKVARIDLRGLGLSRVPVETFKNSIESRLLDALALFEHLKQNKVDSFVERPVRDGPWSARVSGREAPRAVGC